MEQYPFSVAVVRNLENIEFHAPVTFIVGENGSGKSTLIEAIAAGTGAISIGAEEIDRDESLASAGALSKYLQLSWSIKRAPTYFLRAEDVFGFIKRIGSMQSDLQELADRYTGEDYGSRLAKGAILGQKYGLTKRYGSNPDGMSHGETFLNLFETRFVPNSLYILDEPEAPLSFTKQLSFLLLVDRMVKRNCQFIITTHSPIIAAYPNSQILVIEDGRLTEVTYQEIESFNLYKDFLNNPNQFLNHLWDES